MCFSTDGYIVCEEFEEILRAAWVEEQELQKQKEKEVCIDVHVQYYICEYQNMYCASKVRTFWLFLANSKGYLRVKM